MTEFWQVFASVGGLAVAVVGLQTTLLLVIVRRSADVVKAELRTEFRTGVSDMKAHVSATMLEHVRLEHPEKDR